VGWWLGDWTIVEIGTSGHVESSRGTEMNSKAFECIKFRGFENTWETSSYLDVIVQSGEVIRQ
jgi:hypothetical protein